MRSWQSLSHTGTISQHVSVNHHTVISSTKLSKDMQHLWAPLQQLSLFVCLTSPQFWSYLSSDQVSQRYPQRMLYTQMPFQPAHQQCQSTKVVNTTQLIGPIENLKGPYFQPSLSVCLSVCVSLTGTSALQRPPFWQNLVTRTVLWSSLAATIMVQIGRRGTVRRLFENLKKFSKITEFEFQNSGPSFFASVSPAYCKKNFDSIRTKLTEEIHFEVCHSGNPPPIVACSGSTGGVQRQSTTEMCGSRNVATASFRGFWPQIRELGAQSGRKNQPACVTNAHKRLSAEIQCDALSKLKSCQL